MTKIAVLGSGGVGDALSNGFIALGHEVTRGSRDTKKLDAWKAKVGDKGKIANFAEAAAWGEVVILAVKGTAAESLVEQLGKTLSGKVVIDTTNPIADAPPQEGVLPYFTDFNSSLMERLQNKAPDARFVKAFSSVGNAQMIRPQLPGGPPTMFICGNDASAKTQVTTLLTECGWETADMGGARSARAIEPLCMLWCIPGFTQNSWMHAFKLLRPTK
jgi:8-hydroxy-5-deazaflavin:NADPH oxidoreductase